VAKNWRKKQTQDRYFRKAKEEGYRARSAYKLIELNEKFKLARPGDRVIDLGAAPGSWSQVAAHAVGAGGRVVAIDLSPIEPLEGVTILQGDVREARTREAIRLQLGGLADVVLSDMAPSTTGIPETDVARSLELAEAALEVARSLGKPDCALVVKVFEGPDLSEFVARVRKNFRAVRVLHPEASRRESRETFVIARGLVAERIE
jgi:23S rRNA (uridine2552-2'-O)-methyltransferase